MSPVVTPPFALLRYFLKWLLVAGAVAALAGSASAGFLFALDWATHTRGTHRWLIALLPLAGFAVGWAYLRAGRRVDAGNNLLLEQIHDPRETVPLRMAPLVLAGTVVSHLFGASVGREGTAVQMGGALADQLPHWLRWPPADRRVVLMTGIAAGFASVFGTPVAGAVFALEVLAIGRLRHEALFPCVAAALLAERVAAAWGVHHTNYVLGAVPSLALRPMLATLVAGAVFGLVALVFARAAHGLGRFSQRRIAYAPLRALVGGVLIAAVVLGLGADRYAGLGIPVIVEAFAQPVPTWDWLAKGALTVLSLGSGFKGGEVTPLFFIGATLGNAMAPLLDLPLGMAAALGFAAVFGGAANTPLAATVLAVEAFGAPIAPYAALACTTAYLLSGHAGIYAAQLKGQGKHTVWAPDDPRR